MASLGIKQAFLCILMLLGVALPMRAQEMNFLYDGDLLFCCTDTANAITDVTTGVEGLSIDHVAVVYRVADEDESLYVIEAVKPVVKITPIDTFMYENPRLLVARVNVDVDIKESVKRCLEMVGKPYDDLYLPGDSAIYCSELVQLNFVNHQGILVFNPVPMSFHDATGEITQYWQEFYRGRGMTVPEGAPGTNPGELSRRQQLTIIGSLTKNELDFKSP
ncbi:MAG: hypothetical protein IKW85_00070 [Muribaculaceae bacterium]|nr:hypothetical protein [Muribaculaceae bacterium]